MFIHIGFTSESGPEVLMGEGNASSLAASRASNISALKIVLSYPFLHPLKQAILAASDMPARYNCKSLCSLLSQRYFSITPAIIGTCDVSIANSLAIAKAISFFISILLCERGMAGYSDAAFSSASKHAWRLSTASCR